jgi:glycerol-3-phosphate dehydrogenase (NAD(P)+)
VAVAGPCIAGELARRVPTCVLFTGRNPEVATRLAELARTDYYHPVVEEDVVGAEACAAMKNAYAMGIALAQGLHERDGGTPGSVAMHNYESAVFAQAIVEMTRLVRALGGAPETPAGLAGVGDLDVTCNGGRTGRFGKLLGLGIGRAEAIARMQGATLECLDILAVLREALPALEQRGELAPGDLPLLDHLAAIALDDAPVHMPFPRFFRSSA